MVGNRNTCSRSAGNSEDVPCRNIKRPTEPTISVPLNVEMAGSSSLPSLFVKVGDIEGWSRGSRSAEVFKTVMTNDFRCNVKREEECYLAMRKERLRVETRL